MSRKLTLDRTGDRPLSFSGTEVAATSSRRENCDASVGSQSISGDGASGNRFWHVISVYRNDGKTRGFIVAVSYLTDWESETDHHSAKVCATEVEVAEFLQSYNPVEWFIGPPSGGSAQEQRHRRLVMDLTLRYKDAVSEVLENLGPERVA